jgi:agmatinase
MKLSALYQSSSRGSFLDVERADAGAAPAGSIAVLGIPGATPYRSAGAYCAEAPARIRQASANYAANRTHYDFDLGEPLLPPGRVLVDCGDVEFDEKDFAANRARIEAAVTTLLQRGAAPLVLGGDDSVQIPLLQAFAARGEITILQIDAHIDWRDEVQGERFGLSSTMRRASELKGVKAMVQVGARGIGSARASDVADAKAWGAQLIDMRTVRAKGIAAAIEAIPVSRPIVVCLDVDGLDPSVLPGVIAPSPGGLGYGDVVELLHGAARRAPIVGFNIVEFVPGSDRSGLGATTVCRLAESGVGMLAAGQRARTSG